MVPRSYGMDRPSIKEIDVVLGEAKIFVDLLEAGDSDHGFLAFCEKWGTFGGVQAVLAKKDFVEFRRRISSAYETKKGQLDKVVNLFSETVRAPALSAIPAGNFDLVLSKNRKSRLPQLTWYARSICGFMYLEVLADLGGISEVCSCTTCGSYFTRSDIKGPPPQHCSNACRQRAYRRRKMAS